MVERVSLHRLRLGGTAAAALVATRRVVRYLSFWTAVCLPVLLVALLVVGIQTPAQAGTFLGLTAVEVVALVVGRAHPGD